MNNIEFNQAKDVLGEKKLNVLGRLYDALHGTPPGVNKIKYRAAHVEDWEELDALEHTHQLIRTDLSGCKYEVRIFSLPFINSFRAQFLLTKMNEIYVYFEKLYKIYHANPIDIKVIKDEFNLSDQEAIEIFYYMKDCHHTFTSTSTNFPFADNNHFVIHEQALKTREYIDIIFDYARWHLLPKNDESLNDAAGLLIGAGFSAAFGMPLASELSESFYGYLTNEKIEAFKNRIKSGKPYGDDKPLDANSIDEGMDLLRECKITQRGYEQFLAELEDRANALGVAREKRWTYQFLVSTFNDLIYQILYIYQSKICPKIYNQSKKYFQNINKIFSKNGTWVFSLNHDMVMEYIAIDYEIPITYGDIKELSFPISNNKMHEQLLFCMTPRSKYFLRDMAFYKGVHGLNLIKLHGGLNEMTYQDDSLVCNLKITQSNTAHLANQLQLFQDEMTFYANGKKVSSGRDKIITNNRGELDVVRNTVLMGGNKFSKTLNFKTGEEKLKLFDDVLEKISKLWIIGYSFSDEHINNRLIKAMHKNEGLQLHIIDPGMSSYPKFLEQFDYNDRLKRAKCTAAEWFDYYQTEKWNMDNSNALKYIFQERIEAFASLNKDLVSAPLN